LTPSTIASDVETVGTRHYEYFARRIADFAGVQPDDGVLGVATGTGALLAAAAGRLGPTGYVVR